jgi:predicted TIM-barrel fold metal-dependent hydrolase
MRIITLEEHISFPEMAALIPKDAPGGFGQSPAMLRMAPKLADITGERLRSMDETGITIQALSVDSAGANLLSQEASPEFAMRYNYLIAEKIAAHRDRFTAFCPPAGNRAACRCR